MPLDTLKSIIQPIKKDTGIFFTPDSVVDFMVGLIDEKILNKKEIYILEPACGMTQFITGIERNRQLLFKRAKKYGIEINKNIIDYIKQSTKQDNKEIINDDFLLWQTELSFDIVIGNPPYGIPSLSEHYTIRIDAQTKEIYKKKFTTWYGKYNVYGAFIEKSIQLLKDEGQLIFITPATFMFLDEFKKLRKFLADNGKTELIYLGENVFRPDANVTSVVLNFVKTKKSAHKLSLAEFKNNQILPVKQLAKWTGEIITFETDFTDGLKNISEHRLGDIYEIRISPRTPEIKKNYHIVQNKTIADENFIPILNGRNLKVNEIIYEPLTDLWIQKTKIKTLRGYFNKGHIVVGLGFRGNRQIAAAYDKKAYPWMGDVYHLFRKHNFSVLDMKLNDEEIVKWLNSEVVRKYIIDVFREVTYHLSITQLKQLPVPSNHEELKNLSKLS
ncbi:MAG: DNA methyltransferase [Euryarchaeota archaeon HGW-Euryarchaeota-1]|nr:MAG: DNA methyltransferase [Euryarchaeota archaeon HGW-Euryarchaeota-1]